MYLKSIDLYGFKSFANKMIFKFDTGITGIVGPNGSGKSNISDAVRWVLGEQSAKQLRGSKMEDVIFAGTQTRRPLGYCQVDLTIDNQDKRMPIDYSEVTVSRRVYRSGDSDFYINGSPCRLKDIHELFMDTGVGREGYSIIGQGQVDKILSSKPGDRRDLFDEAAGIVKYKSRKSQAEKKLIDSEADLERIVDIIIELEGQREGLHAQAETARKYLDLREQLKKLEIHSFIELIDAFEQELQQLKGKAEIAKKDLQDKEAEYQLMAKEHQTYEARFEEVELSLESNREAITSASLEIEKYQSAISLAKEKKSNTQRMIEKCRLDMDKISTEEIARQQNLNDWKGKVDKQGIVIREKKQDIDAQQQVIFDIQQEINEKETRIETIQSNMIERLNASSNLKSEFNRYEVMIESDTNRLEQMKRRKEVVSKTLETIEVEGTKQEASIHAFEEQQKKLLDQKLRLRRQIENKEKDMHQFEQVLDSERHQLNKDRSRLEAMKDMEEQYEGYYLSVKKIMELKDPGALGVIAELIQVQSQYEKAIEIALGSNVQNIVTTDEQKARQFIDYLKKHRYGRGTFLPMTTVKGKVLTGYNDGQGCLGVASELVECDASYRPIIRQLLGRILIVDNLTNGIALAKRNNQRYRIITLDGDVISAGGAMSGGAFNKERGQLLSRRNEMEQLQESIDGREKSFQEKVNRQQQEKTALSELQNRIEEIRNEEQDLNIEFHTLSNSYQNLLEDQKNYRDEIQEIESEQGALEARMDELGRAKEDVLASIEGTQIDHTDAESQVKSLNEVIVVLKEDLIGLNEALTADKMTLSSMEQEHVHMCDTVVRLESEVSYHHDETTRLRKEMNHHELELLKLEQQIEQTVSEQDKARETLEVLQSQLADLRKERQELQIKKGQLDSRKEMAYEDTSRLEKESIKLEGQIEKLELQKENRINYMWDEYELTYSMCVEARTPIDIEDKDVPDMILSYRQAMKRLGPVNVQAIEEYQQVNERYTFLSTQRDDLLEAKAKLVEIIEDLNQQMRQQFEEKFHEINEQFGRVFKELFGGGKGFLELTDDEDLLEAGITIIAQPPGKKLQNMMLLSGGERAFTAIALLFAIQSLRPSPFCVLDEIEAALDDANVDRFAAYLHKLTDQTQFIVITHRKGTMEAADALYGITMQEKGVSTQVSVKLIQDQLDEQEARV